MKNLKKRIKRAIDNKLKTDTFVTSGLFAKYAKFEDGKTTIYWSDDTKTTIKCSENDEFDKETGVALCILKKICGNTGRFNTVISKIISKAKRCDKIKEKRDAENKKIAENKAKKKAARIERFKKKYPNVQENIDYKLNKIIKCLKDNGFSI